MGETENYVDKILRMIRMCPKNHLAADYGSVYFAVRTYLVCDVSFIIKW